MTHFRIVAALAQLLTFLWLWRIGSLKRYRAFAIYSLCLGTLGLATATMNVGHAYYARLWTATEPLIWIGQAIIAVEFYTIIRRHYPGNSRETRRDDHYIFTGALCVGFVIALVPSFVEISRLPDEHGMAFWRDLTMIIERIVSTGLAMFLIAAALLHWFFPTRIAANAIRHGWFLALYLCAIAALHFTGARWSPDRANELCLPIVQGCVTLWPLAFWVKGDPPFPKAGDSIGVDQAFEKSEALFGLRRQ